MIRLYSFIGLLLFSAAGWAQSGNLQGLIKDGDNADEGLFGAAVYLAGLESKGVFTGVDGTFQIPDVPPGTYKLTCQFITYETIEQEVVVRANETTKVSVTMQSGGVDIAAHTVTEKLETAGENENMALIQRSKAKSVVEVISAQEMKKRGDSKLNDVVKRSVGTTVEGGKYVYVRGLSDRYSKTLLNGGEIPGLDPDRNSVQIDLFPTMVVKQLQIVKSFRPDLPGDFTGGLVNIATKDFPDSLTFSYSTSFGYNTQSSFNKNFLNSQGGSLDWLGFDDGSRGIPIAARTKIPALFEDNAKLMQITRSFSKEMAPTRSMSFMNHSHSATLGNNYNLGKMKAGLIAGLTYQHALSHFAEDAQTGTYELLGNVAEKDQLDVNRKLIDERSTQSTLWAALISGGLMFNDSNAIGFTYLRTQNGISGASIQQGEIPEDQEGLFYVTNAITYQQRSMQTIQLNGNHQGSKMRSTWLVTYTNSAQSEPDLRYFNYDYTLGRADADTVFDIQPAIYVEPNRFYREMFETNIDAKLNFEIPLAIGTGSENNMLKVGLSNVMKDRSMIENRFGYTTDAEFDGSVTDFLSDENMTEAGLLTAPSSSIYIVDNTERRNSYQATQRVSAAYAMTDLELNQHLQVLAGARVEYTDVLVKSADTSLTPGEMSNLDLLPALNVNYLFTKKFKVKTAYSRTVARPVFRELAPFATFDFATGWVKVGNPNLERTIVDNFDLRLERYFGAGELFAVSGFYKSFANPIEVVFNPIASNSEVTWRNVDQATVLGAEVEIRKKLDFIDTTLSNISIGGNFTYVHSRVGIDSLELVAIRANDPDHVTNRTMFGQSPYIVNAFIGYTNDSLGLDVNLSFNISGPRLAVVMIGATPNVFDQPRGQLDIAMTKRIGNNFSVKLRGRNLLNPLYKMSHEYKGQEYIFNSYRTGRVFSAAVSYSF